MARPSLSRCVADHRLVALELREADSPPRSGPPSLSQLKENFEALKLIPKVTDEVRKEIDNLFENKPNQLPTYGREFN